MQYIILQCITLGGRLGGQKKDTNHRHLFKSPNVNSLWSKFLVQKHIFLVMFEKATKYYLDKTQTKDLK